jgi:predicted nucleotidyltransferase
MAKVFRPSLVDILDKYPLRLLVYFGSYGTEYYDPGRSDIDIAYLSAVDFDHDTLGSFLRDLMLYHKTGNIDLVNLKTATPLLKYAIVTEGRLIHEEREGFFLEYASYCLRYYFDTKHFREQARSSFQERLEALLNEHS